jgi:ankyrin repeat protein
MESGFLYACGYGRHDVVRFLLDRGADPAVHNDMNQTGLHWAAYGPHIEVVKLLLEAGAPVDVPDALRRRPLDWAIGAYMGAGTDDERRRAHEMVARLIRAGATPDLDRLEPRIQERIRANEQLAAALRGEMR